MKAVVNTESGVFGYNIVDSSLMELPWFGCGQGCIEIINVLVNEHLESQLPQCLTTTSTE